MDYAKESLRKHAQWKGKIEITSRVPVETKEDLSLAYTPGVAAACLAIQDAPDLSYKLTRRHNLCLVATDGTAVLGLGVPARQEDDLVRRPRRPGHRQRQGDRQKGGGPGLEPERPHR